MDLLTYYNFALIGSSDFRGGHDVRFEASLLLTSLYLCWSQSRSNEYQVETSFVIMLFNIGTVIGYGKVARLLRSQ